MTGTQVLALGGLIASIASILGGWLEAPRLIGIGAGGVMILANVIAFGLERRHKQRLARHASRHVR